MSTAPAPACTVPGCTGHLQDGYCDVCGTPGAPSPAVPDPSSAGVVAPPSAGASAASPRTVSLAAADPVSARSSRTSSSSRLASQALGSARVGGSRRTRRLGTSSTRLRGQRLGAGLTTVPPTPVADPLSVVMADPQVAEEKRFCPACGSAVGRGRDGAPGRTEGFCPSCGARFDFTPSLRAGDLVGGQYEVVGCLAHGGLGWIYLARDHNVSDRWVVLKGLLNSADPDAYAAAVAERQFLAAVEHPLIVEIYNFAMHAGAGYIVMEYVGGVSLKQILKDRRDRAGHIDPLPVDQALAYVLEVLPAFGYLHDKGLLFCDFKPDNLVSQGDGIKLIDLGGVRRIDDLTSAIFGTVGYQAPEVPDVGPSVASDIYTIGRTLATLVLDFRGNTTTYVASLPPVSQTPVLATYDSFARLLAKACAPDPNDRFGSADELRVQMLGVLREVVAIDRGRSAAATATSASPLFATPDIEAADRPPTWRELPVLKVDETDRAFAWLTGVTVSEPRARVEALAQAPDVTTEVLLARAQAEIGAGLPDAARDTVARILDADPWEWRAAWTTGLAELAAGDPAGARASFNAVYGQVPGELAPKLALAAACELTGELDVAESLYLTCAACDANYTSAAAFGLARIRRRRGDLDGALRALDLVSPTRGSYPLARLTRAQLLSGSGRGFDDLTRALDGLDDVPLPDTDRAEVRLLALRTALDLMVAGTTPPHAASMAGVELTEPALRDATEAAYRRLARLVPADQRVAAVDEANRVRRWTLR